MLHESRNFFSSFIHCCIPRVYNSTWHRVSICQIFITWIKVLVLEASRTGVSNEVWGQQWWKCVIGKRLGVRPVCRFLPLEGSSSPGAGNSQWKLCAQEKLESSKSRATLRLSLMKFCYMSSMNFFKSHKLLSPTLLQIKKKIQTDLRRLHTAHGHRTMTPPRQGWEQGLSASALLTTGPMGGCRAHPRMLSSISGLYPLEVNSTTLQCDKQNCLGHHHTSPGVGEVTHLLYGITALQIWEQKEAVGQVATCMWGQLPFSDLESYKLYHSYKTKNKKLLKTE